MDLLYVRDTVECRVTAEESDSRQFRAGPCVIPATDFRGLREEGVQIEEAARRLPVEEERRLLLVLEPPQLLDDQLAGEQRQVPRGEQPPHAHRRRLRAQVEGGGQQNPGNLRPVQRLRQRPVQGTRFCPPPPAARSSRFSRFFSHSFQDTSVAFSSKSDVWSTENNYLSLIASLDNCSACGRALGSLLLITFLFLVNSLLK